MALRTARVIISNEKPLKIRSMPTIRPIAHNAVTGIPAHMMKESTRDAIPLKGSTAETQRTQREKGKRKKEKD